MLGRVRLRSPRTDRVRRWELLRQAIRMMTNQRGSLRIDEDWLALDYND